MSRRGSKRKHVLQLSDSNSKLHRYGYSKGFHSKEKKAKGLALSLVDNYSDSDSNETSDNEEDINEAPETNSGNTEEETAADVKKETVGVQFANMDSELKNFLSEIEAISVPAEASEPTEPAPVRVEKDNKASSKETTASSTSCVDAQKKQKPNPYTMFVKGAVEFMPPKPHPDIKTTDKNDPHVPEEEDLPDEPMTSWQMVQDDSTQYYYYWNMESNQVTWEIPPDYTQYLLLHQEYLEKMAKYPPDILEKLKEKKAKKYADAEQSESIAVNQKSGVQSFPYADQVTPAAPLSLSLSSLYTLPDPNLIDYQRKKDNDIFTNSSVAAEMQTTKTSSVNPLAKIVPYLSDQEDEDDLSSDSKPSSNKLPSPKKTIQAPTKSTQLESSSQGNKTFEIKFSTSQKPLCAVGNVHHNSVDKAQPKTTVPVKEVEKSVTSLDIEKTLPVLNVVIKEPCCVDDIINSIVQPEMKSPLAKENISKQNEVPFIDSTCIKVEVTDHSETVHTDTILKQDSLDVLFDKIKKELLPSENHSTLSEKESLPCATEKIFQDLSPEKSLDQKELKVEAVEHVETARSAKVTVDKQEKSPKKSGSKSKSEDHQEKKKVINIVAYGGSDEEDMSGKERRKELKPSSSKKKKKDKRRESRRHSKDDKAAAYPALFDGKLDKDVISKVTDTLDQAISDIVSKTVGKPTGQSDEDIDFDDLDDIDRALEVALEKKLEQKKVELSTLDTEEMSGSTVTFAAEDTPPAPPDISPSTQTVEAHPDTPLENPTSPPVQDRAEELKEVDEDDQLKETIKSMVELSLNKLEFLDITTENLSRLQILLIELQTRQADWLAGGLSTPYMYEQLKVAEGLLEQYELSAVPDGWACQWDRANNRYYYRNKSTNRIQWEYPEAEGKDKVDDNVASGQEEADVICTKVESAPAAETPRKPRSRRGSHHRKREEKDRNKYDKRSSSHHYRRKRRRRRDHSSGSESSETSQQHRRHHKSKKKKSHRKERSPSVKIVESMSTTESHPQVDPEVVKTPQETSEEKPQPPPTPILEAPPPPPPEVASGDSNVVQDMEESADEADQPVDFMYSLEEGTAYHMGMDGLCVGSSSMGIISKPPQIVLPQQCYSEALMPDVYAAQNYYSSALMMTTGQPDPYTLTSTIQPTYSEATPAPVETDTSEAVTEETEKQHKKKKKEKQKSLTIGSNLMMKKKHMSSMVQKWQKVKKEVEKEDMDKEMRQAAIRKKIEELK